MKTLRFSILLISCLTIFACNNLPKTAKTETFKVWGNCGMCKKNIEGSLNLPGIVDAEWNEDTKLIEVVYDTTKIGLDQIKKTIASVGYDNDAYTGENDAYSKLPGCCQYERKLDAVKP